MGAQQQFNDMMAQLIDDVAGKPIEPALGDELNERFPVHSGFFMYVKHLAEEGIKEGWLCQHENKGVRYSRPIDATEASKNFSVDIVRMKDLKGPFHAHPNGEICMIMPITPGAKFDGRSAGWCAYAPGSAHYPAISEGEAIVLYLLPQGAIDFKARPPA